ncbi:MAG: phage portal protein [Chromatiales bacterium]
MARKRKKKQRMAAEKRRNNAENNVSGGSPLSSGSTGSPFYHWLSDGLSSAGVAVNEHTAMCVSAVYACLGLIGGAIASMPVHIYQRTADGRARVDHDLWWMLNQEPNANCTAATFWEYLSTSRGLHGDGFAKILRASSLSPRIVGFEALHPLNVEPFRDGGRIKYVLHRQSGVASEIIDADDMLHVPGLGFNGLRSMSPLRFALRSSVGIALAADEYSARFFGNGARPEWHLL